MRKFVGAVGLIIGIIALLPFDFLAWWTFKDITFSEYVKTDFVNAFGFYSYADSTLEFMGPSYFFVGVLMVLGLLFTGAAVYKEHRGMAVLGGLLMIAAPFLFLWSHSSANLADYTGNLPWNDTLGDFTGDVFFGSNDIGFVYEWYLNLGFFLPFGAGLLALTSAFGKK